MESIFDQALYDIIVKYIGKSPAQLFSVLYVFSVLMKIVFGIIESVVNTTSFEWDNRAWRTIKKSTAYSIFSMIIDVVLRVKMPRDRKK